MAGYSGTPLTKKLGIKSGHSVFIHEAPSEYFDWVSPIPEDVDVKQRMTGALDFIHLFVKDQRSFQKLFTAAKEKLSKNGMLWISWPKKSSKVSTDLDENIIRGFGLKQGLVDVKVCAVSDIWSGLKFVIPVKDR